VESGRIEGGEKVRGGHDADSFDPLSEEVAEVGDVPGQEDVGLGLDRGGKNREVLFREVNRRGKADIGAARQKDAEVFHQAVEGRLPALVGKVPAGFFDSIGGGDQSDFRQGPQDQEPGIRFVGG